MSINDVLFRNDIAPLSYIEPTIKKMILHQRKLKLIRDIEKTKVKDAIKNNETGFLCDGNNLNSLYETLLKILKDERYKKMGASAFEFSNNFKWDKIVKKYIELI